MMVHTPVGSGAGVPCSGGVAWIRSLHCRASMAGASGRAISGRPAGMPLRRLAMSSILPMKQARASLCCSV